MSERHVISRHWTRESARGMEHRLERAQQTLKLSEAGHRAERIAEAMATLRTYNVLITDHLQSEKAKRIPGPGRYVVIAVRR